MGFFEFVDSGIYTAARVACHVQHPLNLPGNIVFRGVELICMRDLAHRMLPVLIGDFIVLLTAFICLALATRVLCYVCTWLKKLLRWIGWTIFLSFCYVFDLTTYKYHTAPLAQAVYRPQESSVSGSNMVEGRIPSHQASIWSIQDDTKALVGSMWRHESHVITARHVVEAALSQVSKGYRVIVVTSKGTIVPFDVFDFDCFVEDVAISPLPTVVQGLTSAKIAPVGEGGGSDFAEVYSGHPTANSSVGKIKTSDIWAHVKYYGSTRGGFSGSPYYVGGKVVGMHLLGSNGYQLGMAASHIKARYLRKEDSEDQIFEKILAQRDELEWRYHPEQDEIEVRLPNGRYKVYSMDDWDEQKSRMNMESQRAFDQLEERIFGDYFHRDSGALPDGVVLEKTGKPNWRKKETGVGESVLPPGVPAPAAQGNLEGPRAAGQQSSQMSGSIVEQLLHTISQQQVIIQDLLVKSSEQTQLLAGLVETVNRLSTVSVSTQTAVNKLTAGLIAAKVVTSEHLKTKKQIDPDALRKSAKAIFAKAVQDLIASGGVPESGILDAMQFAMRDQISTSTDQGSRKPCAPSISRGQPDSAASADMRRLEMRLAGMESLISTLYESSSSESLSGDDSDGSVENPVGKPRRRLRRKKKVKATAGPAVKAKPGPSTSK